MKAYAKINIFLKLSGFIGTFHEIKSRFVRFDGIYDEIEFIKRQSDELILDDQIPNNIIKKALLALENTGFKNELDEFFKSHQIKLIKNIPCGAGLGGGSSDAGAFLRLAIDELNLKISSLNLMKIAASIGSDVPFFASDLQSANVSGVGDIIEPFDDDIPKLNLILSNLFCSTPVVYAKFDELHEQNLAKFNPVLSRKLLNLTSKEILSSYKNTELNDLLQACMAAYDKFYILDDEFLSGSGSAKFKPILI